MNKISLWCEVAANFPASRANRLQAMLKAEGLPGIEAVYLNIWPDYNPPVENHPLHNRNVFPAYGHDLAAEIGLWAWFNAKQNQAADAEMIQRFQQTLQPDGWKLDIEGEWTKGASLSLLLEGAKATERPVHASFAGASPSHVEYDYRGCDMRDIVIDWQAYFNSVGGNGQPEGPRPDIALTELHMPSFVIEGWQYRHHLAGTYGWGKVGPGHETTSDFDSYLTPGAAVHRFGSSPREGGWGRTVTDHKLVPVKAGGKTGLLMGRCRYKMSMVTLNTTRPPVDMATGEGFTWEAVANMARKAGSAQRPVSIYLAERTTDQQVLEIARGAAS